MHINARAGALLLHDMYIHMYAWGILECRPGYIYIYIFTISMSHDLRVSSLQLAKKRYHESEERESSLINGLRKPGLNQW